MTLAERRRELEARAAELIARLADGSRDDAARDALLLDLLRLQAEHVAPYGRLVQARGADPAGAASPRALPALPTDVFRFARVALHPEADDVRVFRTSGTTAAHRGVHALSDLALYDAAAQAAARYALFPDLERMRLVVFAPTEGESPESSLGYMLGRFGAFFGEGASTWVVRDGRVDAARLSAALGEAVAEGAPVALLGTSFAFVHAEDALGARRFALAPGSRVMQTGGFKGRAREVAPAHMRELLGARYGVPEHAVVAEYGMTELSSQMYETTLRDPEARRVLWVPGWVRAEAVDPETLTPVPAGEVGILRIDDVANVGSCAAIQTADLARVDEAGIELLGRAADATPRGCSLAMDEVLGAGALR